MSRVKTGMQTLNDPDGAPTATCWLDDADMNAVLRVISADESSDDGRSQWVWVRFPNGDLMLGVFPQGDTYFDTEVGRQV